MGTVRIGGIVQNSPSTQFWLEADIIGQSISGNYSTVRCYLRAANGPSGNTTSQFNNFGAQIGFIDGIGEFGRHQGQPFLPAGYAQNQTRWHDGPFDVNVGHDGNGYLNGINLRMRLAYGNVNGDWTAWMGGFPRIPKPPAAPTPIGFDQIMPTSMRYRFSANSDNGAAVEEWQAQIATNSAFTTGVQTVSSSGTTTFTNLTPATTYYARSRGRNVAGWGAWSLTLSAMTASGAYVSLNGSWLPVPVYVSDGTNWNVAELQVSNGTSWVEPL